MAKTKTVAKKKTVKKATKKKTVQKEKFSEVEKIRKQLIEQKSSIATQRFLKANSCLLSSYARKLYDFCEYGEDETTDRVEQIASEVLAVMANRMIQPLLLSSRKGYEERAKLGKKISLNVLKAAAEIDVRFAPDWWED